jgi:hypothetical protein
MFQHSGGQSGRRLNRAIGAELTAWRAAETIDFGSPARLGYESRQLGKARKATATRTSGDMPGGVVPCAGAAPARRVAMQTLAQSVYLDSEFGALSELPRSGSSLENPYVYDSSARELQAMAAAGLVKIIDEQRNRSHGGLISRVTFQRLR